MCGRIWLRDQPLIRVPANDFRALCVLNEHTVSVHVKQKGTTDQTVGELQEMCRTGKSKS